MANGKWLETPTAWIYCSVCGEEPPEETNIRTRFCPNCGAEMENYKWQKQITNADRIRAMTDEELAEMLCSGTCKYCHSYNKDCEILEWLRKEVDDGHTE